MSQCINTNSLEYQTLKKRSGISNSMLEALCTTYINKYGRLPYLDELPQADSESNFRETFKVNSHNGVKVETILEKTGANTVEEANASINNDYRDLEVTIFPVDEDALVEIEHRPTVNNFNITETQVDSNPNNYLVFNNALQKLSNLYGIKFNEITDAELNSEEWRELVTDIEAVNAFIYNGEIYINLDRNSVDAPVHELMHILIGSMRFTNPKIYQQLVDSIQSIPEYEYLLQQYPNRSRNDVNEEIFVTEVAKYLSSLPSNIDQLEDSFKYEILYNVKRTLDTILMGQDSVKTISNDRLFDKSLKELAQEVKSSIMTNNFRGTINVEGAEIHRKLNNIKSDLIKQNLLEEICE